MYGGPRHEPFWGGFLIYMVDICTPTTTSTWIDYASLGRDGGCAIDCVLDVFCDGHILHERVDPASGATDSILRTMEPIKDNRCCICVKKGPHVYTQSRRTDDQSRTSVWTRAVPLLWHTRGGYVRNVRDCHVDDHAARLCITPYVNSVHVLDKREYPPLIPPQSRWVIRGHVLIMSNTYS